MNIIRLFFESSLFNFYFYGKGMEKQTYTQQLFAAVKSGLYKAYTSNEVIEELKRDTPEKYAKMYELIGKYGIIILPRNDDAKRLRDLYIANNIIPEKYHDDALHIATATVHGIDFIVSYNYNHIVKLKTLIGTGLVNRSEGYQIVGISTSKELIDYGKSQES